MNHQAISKFENQLKDIYTFIVALSIPRDVSFSIRTAFETDVVKLKLPYCSGMCQASNLFLVIILRIADKDIQVYVVETAIDSFFYMHLLTFGPYCWGKRPR
jgi:hypothetical protein